MNYSEPVANRVDFCYNIIITELRKKGYIADMDMNDVYLLSPDALRAAGATKPVG